MDPYADGALWTDGHEMVIEKDVAEGGGGLFWLCHKWLMDPAISWLLFTMLFNRTVLNNQGEGSRMIDPMIEFTCDSISIESNLAERH